MRVRWREAVSSAQHCWVPLSGGKAHDLLSAHRAAVDSEVIKGDTQIWIVELRRAQIVQRCAAEAGGIERHCRVLADRLTVEVKGASATGENDFNMRPRPCGRGRKLLICCSVMLTVRIRKRSLFALAPVHEQHPQIGKRTAQHNPARFPCFSGARRRLCCRGFGNGYNPRSNGGAGRDASAGGFHIALIHFPCRVAEQSRTPCPRIGLIVARLAAGAKLTLDLGAPVRFGVSRSRSNFRPLEPG